VPETLDHGSLIGKKDAAGAVVSCAGYRFPPSPIEVFQNRRVTPGGGSSFATETIIPPPPRLNRESRERRWPIPFVLLTK
jgi:hypothetical protein